MIECERNFFIAKLKERGVAIVEDELGFWHIDGPSDLEGWFLDSEHYQLNSFGGFDEAIPYALLYALEESL